MFTKTPKLSPIQQQLKEQIQNSHCKAQCYLQMYQSQETKIAIINLTHQLDNKILAPIVQQLIQNQSAINNTQNVQQSLSYCYRILRDKCRLQQFNKESLNSILKIVGLFVIFVLAITACKLFIFWLLQPTQTSNICQTVDYLLSKADLNQQAQTDNEISWWQSFSVVKVYLVFGIYFFSLIMTHCTQYMTKHFRVFMVCLKQIKRLKLSIMDAWNDQIGNHQGD